MHSRLVSLWQNRPSRIELETAIKTFTLSQWLLLIIAFVFLAGSTLGLLILVNQKLLVNVPTYGGERTEGIVGTPRFINPILAISDADKDLTALVYSGLVRKDTYGNIVPDLASSYIVSEDGLTYTFTIRPTAVFHDGKKVTSKDVIYTISEAKDSLVKSPKKVNWDGIAVTAPNDETVVFTLKQRYASFLENATIGILPAHLWQDLTPEQFSLSDLNIHPVGSGPYEIKKISRTSSGIPSLYELSSFKKYVLGRPYLDTLVLRFYANERTLIDAFENGSVDAINSISSLEAKRLSEKKYTIQTTSLPRVFALYFNQSQNPLFTDKNVIRALELAISKTQIVDDVLNSYGTPIASPIPPLLLSQTKISNENNDSSLERAAVILTKDGWEKNTEGIWEKKEKTKNKTTKTTKLTFSISTSDAPELKNAAQKIKEELEAFGVQVDLKVFEMGALNQNIIRTRKYEALFFGQVINHETDLFAFWHSSQRNDPGLNIAMYTNAKADKYLEQAAGTLDKKKRTDLYELFEQEVINDAPAIFIYNPYFIYVTRDTTNGIALNRITGASDRFDDVYLWYQEQEHIWSFFTQNTTN